MSGLFSADEFGPGFLLKLVGILSAGVLLAIAGLTIMGAIAFYRDRENSAHAFAAMFVRGEILRILTVVAITFVVGWLALVSKIDGSAAAAILSGIAGYVLGGLSTRRQDASPPEPDDKAQCHPSQR